MSVVRTSRTLVISKRIFAISLSIFQLSAFAASATELAGLTASDGAADDHFGIAVDYSGDTAVVGADRHDHGGLATDDLGAAYVFVRDSSGVLCGSEWCENTELMASDAYVGQQFGNAVAIRDDTMFVAARLDDDFGVDSGAVYVFTRDGSGNWTELAKLTASDAAPGDEFGSSVSTDIDNAGTPAVIIGALNDDDNGVDSGSAYVFTRDGSGNWNQAAKLTASDGVAGDAFGVDVSIHRGSVIVGAHLDDGMGAAYAFDGDGATWTETFKFTAPDGAAGDMFGVRVAVDREIAVIGSPGDDDLGSNSGSAYVFTRKFIGETCVVTGTADPWCQAAKLWAPDGAAGDSFGFGVSVSGLVVAVTADTHPFDYDDLRRHRNDRDKVRPDHRLYNGHDHPGSRERERLLRAVGPVRVLGKRPLQQSVRHRTGKLQSGRRLGVGDRGDRHEPPGRVALRRKLHHDVRESDR